MTWRGAFCVVTLSASKASSSAAMYFAYPHPRRATAPLRRSPRSFQHPLRRGWRQIIAGDPAVQPTTRRWLGSSYLFSSSPGQLFAIYRASRACTRSSPSFGHSSELQERRKTSNATWPLCWKPQAGSARMQRLFWNTCKQTTLNVPFPYFKFFSHPVDVRHFFHKA